MHDSQSSTRALIRRGQKGDGPAWDRAFARILARVRGWATRRLPRQARDVADTQDAVQDAALKAWRRIDQLNIDNPGALEAYLRQTVRYRIGEMAQLAALRPVLLAVDDGTAGEMRNPEELLLEGEAAERYRVAFAALDLTEREALVARTEMGYSYQQIAELTGKKSADAARMVVNRAVDKLRHAVNDAGE